MMSSIVQTHDIRHSSFLFVLDSVLQFPSSASWAFLSIFLPLMNRLPKSNLSGFVNMCSSFDLSIACRSMILRSFSEVYLSTLYASLFMGSSVNVSPGEF